MNKTLKQLVSELPEVYQTIYGHSEWAAEASRDCFDRLQVIGDLYDALSQKRGRPLRVLDLGCAQGFFSLSLAEKGATVHGVDFQEQNIQVCNALAEEHPKLAATFVKDQIENVINKLQPNEYDLIIGLSVFHHIVHIHGIEQVKTWFGRLAECSDAMILEIALQKEPLYWGPSQPNDPRELIQNCAFYHQIASFNTHLSDIFRPLYIVSNHFLILNDICEPFQSWRNWPYNGSKEAHKGSRRYYFGEEFIGKVYNFNFAALNLSPEENERSKEELRCEIDILSSPPKNFPTPKFLGGDIGENDGWLVMEHLPGDLLLDLLQRKASLDIDKVFSSLLVQLVALEQAGLYHDDVRTWNILVDNSSNARLIDFGSINGTPQDCVWPDNLYQSFMALVNEIVNPFPTKLSFMRPFASSPFNLPEPYCNWLYAVWQHPVAQWNFSLISALFDKRHTLPSPVLDGAMQWMISLEKGLQLQQLYLHHRENLFEQLQKECGVKFADLRKLEQSLIIQYEISLKQQEALLEEASLQEASLQEASLQHQDILQKQEIDSKIHGEKLLAAIASAENINRQLTERNEQLTRQLEAIMRSRSWRITGPYRYFGKQSLLLRQYGVKQRGRHLLKRIIKAVYARVQKRPVLKARLINLTHKVGLYPQVLMIYRRIYPQGAPASGQVASTEVLKDELAKQVDNLNTVPVQVRDIFYKLKDKK